MLKSITWTINMTVYSSFICFWITRLIKNNLTFIALLNSIIEAITCHGFSVSIQCSWVLYGSFAHLWTISIIEFTYSSLWSRVNLSLPMTLAKWILSHLNPLSPRGFSVEYSNKPLHKSLPTWFRCGEIGYVLPL